MDSRFLSVVSKIESRFVFVHLLRGIDPFSGHGPDCGDNFESFSKTFWYDSPMASVLLESPHRELSSAELLYAEYR